ncbi:MAG: hypothetical protein SCH98_10055 [Deferrisomatales bacterium]|nr:hypothetical protein [Deferrisomatales bacterium]
MRSERLRVLRAEMLDDAEAFERLVGKYEGMKRKLARIEPDEFDYVGLAYTIVNLYSLMENYFLRVAKCFENDVDRSSWHRELVRRMALSIEGVRPAVLTAEEARAIDELRAFRHVFRHIYQTELDSEKLQLVDSRTPQAVGAFKAAHERLLANLDALIAEVDST